MRSLGPGPAEALVFFVTETVEEGVSRQREATPRGARMVMTGFNAELRIDMGLSSVERQDPQARGPACPNDLAVERLTCGVLVAGDERVGLVDRPSLRGSPEAVN